MEMKYEICSKCERLLTKSRFTNSNICNSCTEKINTKQTNNQMLKFKVQGTVTFQVECEIEAPSLEEAQRIEYEELVNGDFESVNADYKLLNIVQVA